MERAEHLSLNYSCFGIFRLEVSALLIEFNECIQSEIEFFNSIKMSTDQFNGRDRLTANVICHFHGREACEIRHEP